MDDKDKFRFLTGLFGALNIALLVLNVILISDLVTGSGAVAPGAGGLPPSDKPFRGVTSIGEFGKVGALESSSPGIQRFDPSAPPRDGGGIKPGKPANVQLGALSDFSGPGPESEPSKQASEPEIKMGVNTTESYAIFLELMNRKLDKAITETGREPSVRVTAADIAISVNAFKNGDRREAVRALEILKQGFEEAGAAIPGEILVKLGTGENPGGSP